jgi:hypothetical protein
MLTFQEWYNSYYKPKRKKIMKESADALNAGDIIYVAAMLTRESQQRLYESISRQVAVPQDWKKFCHHMTIRFKPTDVSQLPVLGEEVSLIVTEVAADEKGVAVKVEPNTNSRDLKMPADQLPHVTVAVAPGVSPVYSNELLRKGISVKMPQALVLSAFVGAKTKTGIMPERHDAAYESFT